MSALAMSQIEKHFITNQIYKRSRRYFDVARLNSIEHNQQKQRRKPTRNCKQTIQNKIQLSFISSEDFYNHRRSQELSKLKKRGSKDEDDQIQTNYSFVTKSNLKGFDMEKLLSRQFFSQKIKQNHGVQNQFDNFIMKNSTKPKGRTFDFSKFVGRRQKKLFKEDIKNPQKAQDQQKRKTAYDLNKQYQKIVFNDALFKCLFSDEHERQRTKNIQNSKISKTVKAKQLDIQSVQKGRKATSKNEFASYFPFYHGKGKQQLSQMHMKGLKKNENYWKQQLKRIKNLDFQVVERKQDMISKRKSEIKRTKIVHDNIDQMCSEKFFRRYKPEVQVKQFQK